MRIPVSHPHQHLLSVFQTGHPTRCVVVSPCCFNLHFPDEIQCKASFHVLSCYLWIFFGEVSVKVFGPYFIVFFFFLIEF